MSFRLYGGPLKDAKEWLGSGVAEDEAKGNTRGSKMASFRGKDGKKYTWRSGGDHRLELFREDLPDNQPVATYHREKRFAHVLRISEYPYLQIDNLAMDTLDSLILSFLLIERRRRDGKC